MTSISPYPLTLPKRSNSLDRKPLRRTFKNCEKHPLPHDTCDSQETWPQGRESGECALALTSCSVLENGPCTLPRQESRAGPGGWVMGDLALPLICPEVIVVTGVIPSLSPYDLK